MLTTIDHSTLFNRKGQSKTFGKNTGVPRVDPGMVNFHEYLTGLKDAQIADKTLFFGVHARVLWEEISI